MEVTAYWEGGYTTRVPIRDFEVWIDEPPEYGGTDRGPVPTEMLLASIASCFTMAVHHAARKREVTLPDLAVRVRGEYEGLRFDRIAVEVISSYPDRDELRRLQEQALDYCYVTSTIRSTPELSFGVGDAVADAPPDGREAAEAPAAGHEPAATHEPPPPRG